MGRYYWSKKTEADGLKKIQIWWLKKYQYLEGWRSGSITWTHSWSDSKSSVGISVDMNNDSPNIRINYTQTDNQDGSKKDFDYKILLTTTPCFFGGKRYWFVCPWYTNGRYCGRTVGVLYKDGDYFACRHCYHLTYNSRNLGGISKIAGQVISYPDLERLEKEVKRKYYAGKMTRKHKRYLKKERKSVFQLQIMAGGFGGI